MKKLLAILVGLAFSAPLIAFAAAFPVGVGGTGWVNIVANTILLGNGSSRLATTTAGTNGQALFLLGGVPKWATASTTAASSTLLSDNNTWTGNNTFARASTTLLTIGTGWLPNLATPAGTVLAVDPDGKIIATSSPGGSGTVTSVATGNGIEGGTITTTGTLSLTNWIATTTGETAGQLAYWNTTNGWPAKLSSVATGTISAGSTQITVTAGRAAIGGALAIDCATASASQAGCLSTADWSSFNNRATSTNPFMATYFVATGTVPSLFPNASTTQLTVATGLGIPSGSSQTPVSAGYIAQDTTNGQLKVGNGGGTDIHDPRRNLTLSLSTTTAWAGTSTLPVFVIPQAMTFNTVQCVTDVGTVGVQFQYGTTPTKPTYFVASTTIGTETWLTNNTPTAGATSTISFGTPASSPTAVSCTLVGTITGT